MFIASVDRIIPICRTEHVPRGRMQPIRDPPSMSASSPTHPAPLDIFPGSPD